MTEARAVARYLKIGPRKMRLVLATIRNQPVDQAMIQLTHRPMKAARLAIRVLKSAIAAAQAKKMDRNRLVVSETRADGGPTMKRMMPRSMGRADRILKRSTHLTIVLREGKDVPRAKAKIFQDEGQAQKQKPSKIKAGAGKVKEESVKKESTKKSSKVSA